MANILVLGGGFGGVVAAERLAKTLAAEHQITLISRTDRFIFYPALVRLAFGKCEPDDISFDLRKAMLDRRIRFVKAEVAYVEPYARRVTLAHGDVTGDMPYDYLIFALGRRLATEQVPGFYEHAHHLLNVDAALKFGSAARCFHQGRAIIGSCPGSRLSVPVYETAFALARQLEKTGQREQTRITIIIPETAGGWDGEFGVIASAREALQSALDAHNIELLTDFSISRVTADRIVANNNQEIVYNLLMLLPPFKGVGAGMWQGITDNSEFIRTDRLMRVRDCEQMYAVGDSVNFLGPKMGHMAVMQAEVAAENVAAEIEGREPRAYYTHEAKLVIDEGGSDSIYLHKELWGRAEGEVKQGRFWSWAKRAQEIYFQARHS